MEDLEKEITDLNNYANLTESESQNSALNGLAILGALLFMSSFFTASFYGMNFIATPIV